MSYKSEFASNNTDLRALIAKANTLPEAENLDGVLSTQDDLIAQIATTLETKVSTLEAKDAEIQALNEELKAANESWAGDLTFSGSYASATYFTEAGCYLAVDKQKGMAFVTIQAANNTSYEHISFGSVNVPSGVQHLQNQTTYNANTSGWGSCYYTAAFTGINGKINVDVNFNSINATYDYVEVWLTITYADSGSSASSTTSK